MTDKFNIAEIAHCPTRSKKVEENSCHSIDLLNPKIAAFLNVEEWKIWRKGRKNKENGRLSGIPIAIKDNIAVSGLKLSCGSKMLENFIAPYSATVVRRLEAEGALIFPKTSMDEFGMGNSGLSTPFRPCLNPRNQNFVAGGSSSGSAAAVASGMVPVALGSDTGGSVRLPASYCGVLGFKPSYGRVSRYGLVSYASSLDQIGIFAEDIDNLTFVFDLISGFDPKDETSMALTPTKSYGQRELDNNKTKIVFVKGLVDSQDLCSEVASDYSFFQKMLEQEKFRLSFIEMLAPRQILAIYYTIAMVEAASNLARYDGIRFGHQSADQTASDFVSRSRSEGFGAEVKKRILLGTYLSARSQGESIYLKAKVHRQRLGEWAKALFAENDLLVLPTTPDLVPSVEDFKSSKGSEDTYFADSLNVLANLIGAPAISIPLPTLEGELPRSIQLIAAPGRDEFLLERSKIIIKLLEANTRGQNVARP